MKKEILIAFELDNHNNGEDLEEIGSKLFAMLERDKISINGVSVTPQKMTRNTLLRIENDARNKRNAHHNRAE